MDTLWHDLRFAARQLIKHRTFTLIAVLTLGLGIGANTAVFSVVYGVLLRPLPYPTSSQLVGFAGTFAGNRSEEGVTWTQFQFLSDRGWGLQHFAAETSVGMDLTAAGVADHLAGLRVSHDYFHTLGVAPALGRDFLPDEDQLHGPSVIILGHALWQRRFGSDTTIIGRTVEVGGRPTIVIGVMPAGFASLPDAEAWSTLAQVSQTVGSGENIGVVGRMRRGVSLTEVNAHAQVPFADYHRDFRENGVDSALKLSWVPYGDVMVSDVRTPVRLLFGAIGFVLLIACANVASLVLGRTAARNRELAVRVALGASRRRVARQILTESTLLSLLGAAFGVLIATLGLPALLRLLPPSVPRVGEVHIDASALAFTFGVALVTGLAFGLVPAMLTARTDPQTTLKAGGTRTTGSVGQGRFRDLLVMSEVALALVLLTGAGLMIRTFANLMHIDPGFEPAHEISAEIWLTGSRYDSSTTVSAFYREITSRLNALPGVVSSAVVEAGMPLERGGNLVALLDGQRVKRANDYRTITPRYFATLGTPLRLGRDFADADDGGAQPVAIVSQLFAHRYLGDHALGRVLTLGGNKVPRVVVGVVGDVRSFIGFEPQPTVFIPSAQTPIAFTRVFNGWYPIHVLVRTRGDPALAMAAVARTVQSVDPQVPVGRIRTMSDVLSQSLALERFEMVLLSVFAGLAVILAMVGIYGLISWFVAQSTRDLGVRVALGASAGDVLRLVVGRGLTLTLIGTGAGIVGSIALTRLMASLLYDIKPGDPATLAAVALVVAAVALLACYIPARRAARVDPLVALRSD